MRAQSEAGAAGAASAREAVLGSVPETTLETALSSLGEGRWVLAVSGGRDSMALLDALAMSRGSGIVMVATFDHGTGPAARDACALVVRAATARGLPTVSGVMSPDEGTGEERWRAARWRFLSSWARTLDAAVMTAHTRDDQVETVLMRLLRNAGPRGLAGMSCLAAAPPRDDGGAAHRAAGSTPAIVRPLLGVSRATVAAYARARQVPFIEDPSNVSALFQRNRIRHELLPALEQAHPGFAEWCLDLARRAATWRQEVDALAATLCADGYSRPETERVVVVAAAPVASLREGEWQVLWPALAARAGIALDRRGLVRAATWAPRASDGSHIPLSGDARIERTRSTFVIRKGLTRAT